MTAEERVGQLEVKNAALGEQLVQQLGGFRSEKATGQGQSQESKPEEVKS